MEEKGVTTIEQQGARLDIVSLPSRFIYSCMPNGIEISLRRRVLKGDIAHNVCDEFGGLHTHPHIHTHTRIIQLKEYARVYV